LQAGKRCSSDEHEARHHEPAAQPREPRAEKHETDDADRNQQIRRQCEEAENF
jgi:hypothetical protein